MTYSYHYTEHHTSCLYGPSLSCSLSGSLCSPCSPNAYTRPPPSLGTPDLTSPSSDGAVPSQSTLSPSSPCGDLPNLVQSTSFLDSVPVTLTLEPQDWIGIEDGPAQWSRTAPSNLGAVSKSHVDTRGAISSRAMEVELRRRPAEGFGFVIASQDVMNGSKYRLGCSRNLHLWYLASGCDLVTFVLSLLIVVFGSIKRKCNTFIQYTMLNQIYPTGNISFFLFP